MISSVSVSGNLIIGLMKRLNGLQIFLGVVVFIGIWASAAFSAMKIDSYVTGNGTSVSWKEGYEAGTVTFGAIACTAIICLVWVEVIRFKNRAN
jgi:hypothetical protein